MRRKYHASQNAKHDRKPKTIATGQLVPNTRRLQSSTSSGGQVSSANAKVLRLPISRVRFRSDDSN